MGAYAGNSRLAYQKGDLIFDTGALRWAAGEYGDVAGDLRTTVKDLEDLLKGLKDSGWTTPAGTAFFDMTNTNWSDNIEKYASLLETLQSILVSAANDYEALVRDSIETTKLNI